MSSSKPTDGMLQILNNYMELSKTIPAYFMIIYFIFTITRLLGRFVPPLLFQLLIKQKMFAVFKIFFRGFLKFYKNIKFLEKY